MSENPTPATVETAEEQTAVASAESVDTSSDASGKAPEWEGEFDQERASRLVANLREESKKAKEELTEIRKRLNEKEDAEKSEFQRLQERAERAEKELETTRSALLIADVAKEYGVPADLLPTSANREEIEARAKALAEWASASRRPAEDVPGKPKVRLVPGTGEPATGEDFDPAALAAKIRANH
jgi:DNA repair exonuclease SbcCD ATPase subunit